MTSDEHLVWQLNDMLDTARQDFNVMTMKKALVNADFFDRFIVDEADRCILEKGSTICRSKEQVLGFWHLLQKRTVLLTASTCFNLEDLLYQVY